MAVQTTNLASLNAQAIVTVDQSTLPSAGTVGIQISGNFTGTISFFGSVDGQNPFPVFATPLSSAGGPQVTSTQIGGQWAVTVYGYNQVIVRMSSYTAGLAVVSTDVTAAALPFGQVVNMVVNQGSQGGPPLASGLSIYTGAAGSLSTGGIDPVENFQGQGSFTLGILPTSPGDTILTFTDNPWTSGLDLNNKIILSSGVNGVAKEAVIVSPNNVPSSTASVPLAVNLLSPVVLGGSNTATFDSYQINGPQNSPTGAATVFGVSTAAHLLVSPNPQDPKRPLNAAQSARSNPGILAIVEQPDAMGNNDPAAIRRFLEAMLYELRIMNFFMSQLKDSGGMDIPLDYKGLSDTLN